MAVNTPLRIEVRGLLQDKTFHYAKSCAEDLHLSDPDKFPDPDIKGLLEFEWNLYLEAKKAELKGETWAFKENAIIFVNGDLIGGPEEFNEWAREEHDYVNFRPEPLYLTLAEEAYENYLKSSNHDFVYMDVAVRNEPAGRLVFELFSNIVPKTCENFHMLCTGEKGESPNTEYKLHYRDSVFHRVVKNGWVQGGDIWMKRGDGGESIYGSVFEDENFAISHNKRGILGMANKGQPHTNGSQFYITLQPAKWMDTKYVAFGQVIEGTETLRKIEEQETMNQRPLQEVRIIDCGIFNFESSSD